MDNVWCVSPSREFGPLRDVRPGSIVEHEDGSLLLELGDGSSDCGYPSFWAIALSDGADARIIGESRTWARAASWRRL